MFQKLKNDRILKIIKNTEKYLVKNKVLDEESMMTIDQRMYFEHEELRGGAYGKLKIYIDDNSDEFVSKSALDEKSEKSTESEIKIHGILSSFQDIYLKNRIVPKIFYIYQKENSKFKELMMERYEEDIFDIFVDLNVSKKKQKNLLIELLYQVSTNLRLLQKYFNFIHNDLKTNNIFYKLIDKNKGISPGNIIFVLGDLGGSTINFNDNIIFGEVKGSSQELLEGKDIYMLVHIILTFVNGKYRNNLIELLRKWFGNNIDTENSIPTDNKWHHFYTMKEYPKIFKPKNVLKRIKSISKILKN